MYICTLQPLLAAWSWCRELHATERHTADTLSSCSLALWSTGLSEVMHQICCGKACQSHQCHAKPTLVVVQNEVAYEYFGDRFSVTAEQKYNQVHSCVFKPGFAVVTSANVSIPVTLHQQPLRCFWVEASPCNA